MHIEMEKKKQHWGQFANPGTSEEQLLNVNVKSEFIQHILTVNL